MVRKTLTLNAKRNKDSKSVDKMTEDVSQSDPQKCFLKGVAINPFECIGLESGSQQLTVRRVTVAKLRRHQSELRAHD